MFQKFDILNTLMTGAALYLPKLILAIVVIMLGRWLIKFSMKIINKAFLLKNIDPSIQSFLSSLIKASLTVILFVSAASMIGIETTSFIAVIGAAGLAIGLALQGNMANFASGVMILIFKPFRVGDSINVQAYTGTVTSIQLFNTILKTPDFKVVIIPNSMLSNGVITNFTLEPTKRLDLLFIVAHSKDEALAISIIEKIVNDTKNIIKTPAPAVGIIEVTDAHSKITVRVWTLNEHNLEVQFELNGKIKNELCKQGLL